MRAGENNDRWLWHFQAHQRICLGNMTVGVHVDGPNTFSVYNDLSSLLRLLR